MTSSTRSAALPDVPTVAEAESGQGLRGAALPWFGLLAPAGTPADIVNRLQQESAKAMATPALKERLLGWARDPRRHGAGRVRPLHRRRDEEVERGGEGIGRQGRLDRPAATGPAQGRSRALGAQRTKRAWGLCFLVGLRALDRHLDLLLDLACAALRRQRSRGRLAARPCARPRQACRDRSSANAPAPRSRRSRAAARMHRQLERAVDDHVVAHAVHRLRRSGPSSRRAPRRACRG